MLSVPCTKASGEEHGERTHQGTRSEDSGTVEVKNQSIPSVSTTSSNDQMKPCTQNSGQEKEESNIEVLGKHMKVEGGCKGRDL